jgi:heat-inducible transcriptional repressor
MTERQQKLLSAIVEQYAEVASPVGSSLLSKAFNVSSATVRSEMAELERLGFITQPHTSAGRIPTDKGYRFYVNSLTESKDIPPERRAEKALAARVHSAGAPERMIRNAVDTLVELTHNLGLATIGPQLYMSGLSNLFGQPEFINAGQVKLPRRYESGATRRPRARGGAVCLGVLTLNRALYHPRPNKC